MGEAKAAAATPRPTTSWACVTTQVEYEKRSRMACYHEKNVATAASYHPQPLDRLTAAGYREIA